MHKTESRWIVVSQKNAWGSDPDLKTAFANASLREYTALDHFKHYLYDEALRESPLADGLRDWEDYAREEYREQRTDNEPVEVVLFYFDSDLWEGWEVSPMDGGVTFAGYKGPEEDAEQAMKHATLKAYWHQGVITPRY